MDEVLFFEDFLFLEVRYCWMMNEIAFEVRFNSDLKPENILLDAQGNGPFPKIVYLL